MPSTPLPARFQASPFASAAKQARKSLPKSKATSSARKNAAGSSSEDELTDLSDLSDQSVDSDVSLSPPTRAKASSSSRSTRPATTAAKSRGKPAPAKQPRMEVLAPPASRDAIRVVKEMDDRAKLTPVTWKASLPARPYNHLQWYVAAKGIPCTISRTGRGARVTKQELVDAILSAATEQLADVPPVMRTPPRAKKSSKGVVPATAKPLAAPVDVIPHDSPADYDRDVAELEAGNDSTNIWARVRATLALLVKEKKMTADEAADELADIQRRVNAIS